MGNGKDAVIELMKKYHVPLTRENYLHVAYLGSRPQEELPEDVQEALAKLPSGGPKTAKDQVEEILAKAPDHQWYRDLQRRTKMSDEEMLDWLNHN